MGLQTDVGTLGSREWDKNDVQLDSSRRQRGRNVTKLHCAVTHLGSHDGGGPHNEAAKCAPRGPEPNDGPR
jgi:hypothetical protein